ncbi:hypothetical protein J4Q44_G00386600 [Coregonus suidteri]|uniref:Uncharacterized protein n=1 Tax=Coregonus suidteri TaxID=861788 RepID=A0AAN8KLD0_9TELE
MRTNLDQLVLTKESKTPDLSLNTWGKEACGGRPYPTKSSLKLARDQQSQMKDTSTEESKAYDMINRIGSDSNGENLPTMRVLKQHHRNALTTGASKASVICRKLQADTLVSGDVEKSLKFSFIMAHPIASDQLRAGTVLYYQSWLQSDAESLL